MELRYKEYVEVRERKRRRLQQEGKYICVFCTVKLPIERPEDEVKADCHHLDGRDGDALTDEEFLSFAHHDCHMDYHDKPKEKLWWYPNFITNLTNQWPSLVEKEQNRKHSTV